MTTEELWRESGISGEYSAWAFGDDSDQLASLVKDGRKTATCSLLCFYELEKEPIPQIGQYSVILDSKNEAVCIIRTTNAYITTFDDVGEKHAFMEGEGDRTLDYWKRVHRDFFTKELAAIGEALDGKTKIVCEEFEVVYKTECLS